MSTSILERVIQPTAADLSPEQAEGLLLWRFDDFDRDRTRVLVQVAENGS